MNVPGISKPLTTMAEVGRQVRPRLQPRTVYLAVAGLTLVVVAERLFGWPASLTIGAMFMVGLAAIASEALARRERPQPVVVVGEPSESALIAGLLAAVRGEPVARERTLDAAIAYCATRPGTTIVVSNPDAAVDLTPVEIEGRQVPIMAGTDVVGRLLGRLPVDIAANDRWFATQGATRDLPGFYRTAKRGIDLVVASVGGLVLAPVMIAIALLLRLTSTKPVILQEPRVGLGGKTFARYGFQISDPASRIQRAVYRLYLYQLPSLWNVLRGDLSLIGPRPEHPELVQRAAADLPAYHQRHLVKPGLASWAQVRFRYTTSRRDTRLALEHDLYYVKYVSPRLDAQIFGRALWWVIGDVTACLLAVGGTAYLRGARRLRESVRPRAQHAVMVSAAFPRDLAPERADTLQAALIVGAGGAGQLVVRELRRNPSWGYWPVGFIDDDPAKIGARIEGLAVLGATAAIPAVVRREHIDAVVIAIPTASEMVVNQIAELARQTSARILSMPHLGALLRGEARATGLQSIEPTDVLGRPVVVADVDRCRGFIAGRRVLVTGAAGSIGREVARQVAQLQPELLIGLDVNESDLFDLQQELARAGNAAPFQPVVASITNRRRMNEVFAEHRPAIVFHAAAYKHVPMMEQYPQEAVFANTVGSYETAQQAAEHGVERFVLVSTDKAVNPSSVMGATKRLAELAVRAVAAETGMSACAVRFGNVLGSRGSVIPLFERQIAVGGPITVTHPEVRRYFMTIPEAAGLIIQAGAFGDRDVIYMLDMGEEVLIRDLAERMIRLHGLRVGSDIEIVYTGMRPGEKLREDLSLDFEDATPTDHAKIRILRESAAPTRQVPITRAMDRLADVARLGNAREIRQAVMHAILTMDGKVYEVNSGSSITGATERGLEVTSAD